MHGAYISLLNSGADINTVGGKVCYYQCYDHSSCAYAEMYMYTVYYTCIYAILKNTYIHKLVQLKLICSYQYCQQ